MYIGAQEFNTVMRGMENLAQYIICASFSQKRMTYFVTL
jgi:hypothetical protein